MSFWLLPFCARAAPLRALRANTAQAVRPCDSSPVPASHGLLPFCARAAPLRALRALRANTAQAVRGGSSS